VGDRGWISLGEWARICSGRSETTDPDPKH